MGIALRTNCRRTTSIAAASPTATSSDRYKRPGRVFLPAPKESGGRGRIDLEQIREIRGKTATRRRPMKRRKTWTIAVLGIAALALSLTTAGVVVAKKKAPHPGTSTEIDSSVHGKRN